MCKNVQKYDGKINCHGIKLYLMALWHYSNAIHKTVNAMAFLRYV